MMASLIMFMAATSLMAFAVRIKFTPFAVTHHAPMRFTRVNSAHVQMHVSPASPSGEDEELATQAWTAKLNDPTWGAVAAAVLEEPSGDGLFVGHLNEQTWSKAAMTLVDIASKEEARAGKAASPKATVAWHAKIAQAIVPVVAAGLLGMTGATPAFAGDAGAGEQIFSGNCAACHAGGQNVIMPEKTLEQAALEEYLDGGANEKSVMKQVTNGKNAMPAFGGRLSDVDIANVATYVITTAKEGWD